MRYAQIHPVLRGLIGCHEAFRKLGFPSDNLFVILGTEGHATGIAFSVLKLDDGRTFSVGVGMFPGTVQTFETQWREVAKATNDRLVSDEDLERIWHESLPYRDKMGFIMALMSKGIEIPVGLGAPEALS